MGFNKCVMIPIHHYSIIQNNSFHGPKNLLCSIYSSPLPLPLSAQCLLKICIPIMICKVGFFKQFGPFHFWCFVELGSCHFRLVWSAPPLSFYQMIAWTQAREIRVSLCCELTLLLPQSLLYHGNILISYIVFICSIRLSTTI